MLGELETHILHRLASATVTDSSVALAAELWENDESPFTFDMVEWVLRDLNVRGYVTYRVSFFNDVPIHIRVTDEGYSELGYTERHQMIVGTRRNYSREDSMRPGDLTDFRNHRESAIGGACERMTLWEHHDRYPFHIHPPEWEIPMGSIAPDLKTRNPADADAIRDIMAREGVSEDNARKRIRYYRAREIAAAHPVPANQKMKILERLNALGKVQTVKELRESLFLKGFVIDQHSLVHVLWSMQKDQHVTFRERSNAPVEWEGPLTSIRLTKGGIEAANKLRRATRRDPIAEAGDAILEQVFATPDTRVIGYGTTRNSPTREQVIDFATKDARQSRPADGVDNAPVEEVRVDKPLLDRDPVAEAVDSLLEQLKETPVVRYETLPKVVADPERYTPPAPKVDGDYPLICRMVNRQARLESAASILEEEGESDLAIQTLESIRFSEFELEVLQLASAVGLK